MLESVLLTITTLATVVPRTFLGPLVLSSGCQLFRFFLWPITDISSRPMVVQFLARFLLMTFNVVGWIRLGWTIDTSRGRQDRHLGTWLLAITACQFHLPFYSSRMLPNTFALGIVLQVFSFWIGGKISRAAFWLVFATAVFRCDLLLLLVALGLSWIYHRQLTVVEALKIGIAAGVFSLTVTVPLDSLLWQRILWPEGEVFYFNTILGKSSEWGTSPWYWYFLSALPKSMLATLLLVPVAFLRIPEMLVSFERSKRHGLKQDETMLEKEWFPLLLPILGFIVLYSNLGHKEMRFIFPALPVLNLVAASTISRLSYLAFPHKDKMPTVVGRLAFLSGILLLVVSMVGSLSFVAVSRWNYPGGDALLALSKHVDTTEGVAHVHVYIDVATAMSGVSLFGQRAAGGVSPDVEWAFQKDGYEREHSVASSFDGITHILSEKEDLSPLFSSVDVRHGNPRLNLKKFRIDTQPLIYILERRENK